MGLLAGPFFIFFLAQAAADEEYSWSVHGGEWKKVRGMLRCEAFPSSTNAPGAMNRYSLLLQRQKHLRPYRLREEFEFMKFYDRHKTASAGLVVDFTGPNDFTAVFLQVTNRTARLVCLAADSKVPMAMPVAKNFRITRTAAVAVPAVRTGTRYLLTLNRRQDGIDVSLFPGDIHLTVSKPLPSDPSVFGPALAESVCGFHRLEFGLEKGPMTNVLKGSALVRKLVWKKTVVRRQRPVLPPVKSAP